ncbi:MAG: hypothetical protein HN657_02795 [Candidatus Marinimicrobia bacterium]|jgi:Tfp pilus assembly protein PilN|nr:hypothetical protein [Candidatus Neomarinimicrobiota bacterium]MBT3496635.1 hypothetical protein [Candidatus Neomarinimicrobiota bacterium]MBT3692879.1 hypothetical protein [Candidatus Neomarinimicrobiota bacterium]MBT3732806.1 hypothetical protein [Candidatus Neomarinimicrobiota bacterium]MBT4143736.1 hypothetical protein [Candidatus Neomarinimicrobiota bacterium]
MKKYIVINLNQAESKESRQERVQDQIRWGIFALFIILFLGANIRVWTISRGYDRIISQKEQEIAKVKQEIKALRAKGKNLSKDDILSFADLEQNRFLWARNMELLGEMTPNDMAITGLKFKHDKLSISGIVPVYEDRKDFEIINDYIRKLKRNEEFASHYKRIKFVGHNRLSFRGQDIIKFEVLAPAKYTRATQKKRAG